MNNASYPTIDLKIKVDFDPDDWSEEDWLRLKDYLNNQIIQWVKNELQSKDQEEVTMH